MKRNTIALDGLCIGRDGAALAPPITCMLEGGDMLAVMGSNGSGKSTLLKCVAGLVRPVSGTVAILSGEDGVAPPRPLYIGHRGGLSAGMSVYDNVAFWAKASGHPELIAAALEYFDLADITDIGVDTLSAGWRQRVALTRLITMPTGIWLLDEPTSHLDAGGISLLQSLIQTRLEQGGIILIATHMELQGERIKKININDLPIEAQAVA
jgi:heme exporter protein A